MSESDEGEEGSDQTQRGGKKKKAEADPWAELADFAKTQMEVEEEEDESSGIEGMEFDAMLDRKNGKGKGEGKGLGWDVARLRELRDLTLQAEADIMADVLDKRGYGLRQVECFLCNVSVV